MGIGFAGAVLDVAVSDLGRAEAFYVTLIGRDPDLRPQPDQREWHLHRDPDVALRITADPAAERARLLPGWPGLPEPSVKPGVIARLRLPDPDGNEVTLWQDLLRASARR
jgi:hypothetical protein